MGLLKRIFGGPKALAYPSDLESHIKAATEYLQEVTAFHDGVWQIGQADWQIDQDAGTIEFNSPGGMRATAPVQIIGTYNTADGTWLWGWDHPSVDPPLAEHAKQVLAYGKQHGFDVLTTRKLECPEKQCWDFAALACLLCQAQGAFRGPVESTRVFVTFGEVAVEKAS